MHQAEFDNPKPYWTVQQWLHCLENRHNKEIQLGLSRIASVAAKLNLLKPQAKVITVAGTNGKGSTVAALQSIYMAAGYQVGAYTSPHLLVFNERIMVNGQAIPDEALIAAFSLLEKTRGDLHLTYFEMATLAALLYFEQFPLDIIILEVGIGGRLDATNIIDADLAIITTIDYDHQDYLGDTLDKIGFEKAGILRANRPCIYADKNPPESIITKANTLNCPLFINGRDYDYRMTADKFTIFFEQATKEFNRSHLHSNAIAAAYIATRCLLSFLPLTDEQIKVGIDRAFLAGRLQLVKTNSHQVLFDVSHNAQSAANLAAYLEKHFSDRRIHAIFSALGDKDIAAIIAPLKPIVRFWYPALLPGKRAASAQRLEKTLLDHEIESFLCHNRPLSAYQAACNQLRSNDLIVVYGSFLTVCDVLPAVLSSNLELRS